MKIESVVLVTCSVGKKSKQVTFSIVAGKILKEKMIDVFGEDSGISVGHNNEEFSTYALVDSEKKSYKKVFRFKIELKNHGFLDEENMSRPRKYYLIQASRLDRDTRNLETFYIPLSKDDCISAENLKLALQNVSKSEPRCPSIG